MTFASIEGIIGNQQIAFYGLPDTTARQRTGLILDVSSRYWGGGEVMYVYAAGSIRQGGIVVLTPTLVTGGYRIEASEAPNTANLGRAVGVAMTAMTVGQFGWIMVTGMAPVNCTATVAADTAFGIVAAGQGGAIANGKQILNARSISPATTTVVKLGNANSASKLLQINDPGGWFPGLYLSGTGIAAGTTVTDIDASGTQVTLSLVTTAVVNGNVTGTYNNATVYYNVAYLNRSFAQGQVT